MLNNKSGIYLCLIFLVLLCYRNSFASTVNLAKINSVLYFGEKEEGSIDDIIDSLSFEYGKGDYQYYFERSKECFKRGRVYDAIEEISKGIPYCLNKDETCFMLNFRASLYYFLSHENSIFKISTNNDLIKAYKLSKELRYLLKISKINFSSGASTEALRDILNIKKICVKQAEAKLLQQMSSGGRLVCLDDEKYVLARKFPIYLQATALEAYISSTLQKDDNKIIAIYENSLNMTSSVKDDLSSIQSFNYLSTQNNNVLNNLAILYLKSGVSKLSEDALVIAKYINRCDPSNLVFNDTLFLAYIENNLTYEAGQVLEKIKAVLFLEKISYVRYHKTLELVYNRGSFFITLKQIEKLTRLTSKPNISTSELVKDLLFEPNFQIAKIIAREVNQLNSNSESVQVKKFHKLLMNNYGYIINIAVIKKILNFPSIFAFKSGYLTIDDFARQLADSFMFEEQLAQNNEEVVAYITKLDNQYGRDFINIISREMLLKNHMTYSSFCRDFYDNENYLKMDMMKKNVILSSIKQNIIHRNFVIIEPVAKNNKISQKKELQKI